MPLREVGKAPEGPVREKENAFSRAEAARREEARHARQDAEDATAADATPAQLVRIGTPATKRYHRATCGDLEGVAPADRVEFASPWNALDHDYAPCPHCRPGP